MSDNSIITLHAVDDFCSDMYVRTQFDDTYSRSIMHAVYEGDLSALANDDNLIDKMRIKTIYGPEIFELNAKNALKIAKAYKLIMDDTAKY